MRGAHSPTTSAALLHLYLLISSCSGSAAEPSQTGSTARALPTLTTMTQVRKAPCGWTWQ